METTNEFGNLRKEQVTYLDTALSDLVVARCVMENGIYDRNNKLVCLE